MTSNRDALAFVADAGQVSIEHAIKTRGGIDDIRAPSLDKLFRELEKRRARTPS